MKAHSPTVRTGPERRKSAAPAFTLPDTLLCEVSWEVCRQSGGIYTVIRSKAPTAVARWGDRYCLVGPYDPLATAQEFEETPPSGPWVAAIQALQKQGVEVHFGHWLITGRPHVVLLNPRSALGRLGEIKYFLWQHHDIASPAHDSLLNEVLAFGWLVEQFFRALVPTAGPQPPVIAHFHEWLAAAAVPELRRAGLPLALVFTTHATLLGRHLAMHDPWFYDHVPFVDWLADARRFTIEAQVRLERAAAHGAHVLTTLSDITAYECEHLLARKPDVLVPNGLNIERFVALHEFQNLHRLYKERINQFVVAHFFPSYAFDLDQTLYMFISGRYEYRNKGFDLAIEAMARLNGRLKQAGTDKTVVFFLITRQPTRSVNAEALHRRAMMQEMHNTCLAIQEQVGERLFTASATGQSPRLDDLVDDYWRLRLRRMLHAWKSQRLPTIVTHDLADDQHDEILNQLRSCHLLNLQGDPVKVVYHPDFVTANDPLFAMDYDQFVRGCHLGIFPSAYEPWGYTPMECAALGLPAVTSDLAGFGTYLQRHMPDHDHHGLYVLGRRYSSFDAAANRLTDWLARFLQMDRRDRIAQRNRVESCAEQFDWSHLIQHYIEAYQLVLQRMGSAP
jgi:glycogen(starch) synthase